MSQKKCHKSSVDMISSVCGNDDQLGPERNSACKENEIKGTSSCRSGSSIEIFVGSDDFARCSPLRPERRFFVGEPWPDSQSIPVAVATGKVAKSLNTNRRRKLWRLGNRSPKHGGSVKLAMRLLHRNDQSAEHAAAGNAVLKKKNFPHEALRGRITEKNNDRSSHNEGEPNLSSRNRTGAAARLLGSFRGTMQWRRNKQGVKGCNAEGVCGDSCSLQSTTHSSKSQKAVRPGEGARKVSTSQMLCLLGQQYRSASHNPAPARRHKQQKECRSALSCLSWGDSSLAVQ